jgi:hypothetical protein
MIDPVSTTNPHRVWAARQAQLSQPPRAERSSPTDPQPGRATQPATGRLTDPLTAPARVETREDAERTRGVIRLLEAGHFRGVADIRLRLNFADALEGRTLPPLAPPNGNGRAYEKLLAQYNALIRASEPAREPLIDPVTDPASPGAASDTAGAVTRTVPAESTMRMDALA